MPSSRNPEDLLFPKKNMNSYFGLNSGLKRVENGMNFGIKNVLKVVEYGMNSG